MKELGKYDSALQMFVEKPREVDMSGLRFLRFLAERGRFSNRPLSVPMGDNVKKLTEPEIRDYAMKQADSMGDKLALPVIPEGR
jgi:hypothetical protein